MQSLRGNNGGQSQPKKNKCQYYCIKSARIRVFTVPYSSVYRQNHRFCSYTENTGQWNSVFLHILCSVFDKTSNSNSVLLLFIDIHVLVKQLLMKYCWFPFVWTDAQTQSRGKKVTHETLWFTFMLDRYSNKTGIMTTG